MPALGPYQIKIVHKETVTPELIIFDLETPPNFNFQAGQFVTLTIEKNGERKPRSYSILNPPSDKNALRLYIKLLNDGFASDTFRKNKAGDQFMLRGPFGHFIFDTKHQDQEQWFIGSGTGVAPLYSMILEHMPKLPKTKFHLIYGAKNQTELLFNTQLEQLAKKHNNFSYNPTITREEWAGKTGRVQQHLPKDCSNKVFYICGLKELVFETKELLLARGVDESQIHFERYT